MSTTTQILFNSPALHSLKRDQLVKLCKIHSLKASGKNKELIQRLQRHAKTLSPDDPLSIATRSDNSDVKHAADSEDETSDCTGESDMSSNAIARPSEQWEMVMDTIAEVDEETLRSNRGASDCQVGEFGTTVSKASVASSLRAMATSLGLKRNNSKTDGTTSSTSSLSREVIQSSSTLPISDTNGGPEGLAVEPIPGQSNVQGLPAPSAARLSFSQAPATTTIRLVSNPTTTPELLLSPPKLEPFTISFDLVPSTPGGAGPSSVPVWPFSPGEAAQESLYPTIPTFQGFSDPNKQYSPRPGPHDNSDMDLEVDMPGGLVVPSIREPTPEKANPSAQFNTDATPKYSEKPSAEPVDIFSPAPKPQTASTRSRLIIPRSKPFVFGSPLPQHNMSNLQFRTAAQSVLDEMNKRLAEEGIEAVNADVLDSRPTTAEKPVVKQEGNVLRVNDMFERIHQKEFEKMDSITSHYAAKRGAQGVVPQPILSKKRKSSLAVKERPSGIPAARHRPNGSRITSGTSVKTLPGGLSEEDEDEVADRRLSKRPRIEQEESDTPARSDRTSIAPPLPDTEGEVQRQKEREAIRRRLEHNKAKRRSSIGRPSLGRAPPPNAKPTRFGFFASAKSLVQNVWNRGAGSKIPSNVPISKPGHPKEGTKTLPKSTGVKKSAVVSGSSGAPTLSSLMKRIPSGGSSTSTQLNAPCHSTLAVPAVSGEGGGATTSTSTPTWRSPIPSFDPPNTTTANSGSSTVAGYGCSNGRSSSLVGFSSLGRKTGLPANSGGHVSLMGAKLNIRTSAANLPKHETNLPRARTSSTLMAPTASSLAKINSHVRVPHNENSTLAKAATSSKQRPGMSPQPSANLEQITNSPRKQIHSPHPAKTFSQLLSPPPVRPLVSLATAATSVVSQAREEKSTSPVKLPVTHNAKTLPGRKPRISRSKIIARLASQRATGASSSTSAAAQRPGTKVRSSMSVEVAGKTRQSYGGAKTGDIMMSAKKRVRQSEHARRRSRAIASDAQRMNVD